MQQDHKRQQQEKIQKKTKKTKHVTCDETNIHARNLFEQHQDDETKAIPQRQCLTAKTRIENNKRKIVKQPTASQ